MGYAGHICAFRSRNSVGNFWCLSMSNGILNLAIQGPKVCDTESYKQISNGAGSNISAIHFGPLHLLTVITFQFSEIEFLELKFKVKVKSI